MGGMVSRMKEFARLIAREIDPNFANDAELIDWTESGNRYSMFKVGCVICINVIIYFILFS